MSYKISVPVNSRTLELFGRELTVRQLKEIGAERVFLCPGGELSFWDNYEEELEILKHNIDYLHSEGFEVGVWVWTFQFNNGDYVYMKSPCGKNSVSSVCPTDSEYRKKMGGFVADAAKLGIDIFMFDDDFRYTFIDNGFACCCDNHLKMVSDILGEDVTVEIMEKHLLHGKGNKYREAFVRANGQALKDFALEMRKYLDSVNPDIRMGFCSCMGSWDMDGIHPDELAKALAGGTKPFYRLIGAPYWAQGNYWGNRLADVIEFERMEASCRRNNDIEIFSEGDAYPRPRFKTPSAYIEGFDTALRAAGCTDGILKYIIDYTSSPLNETGYLSRHIKNKPLYAEIEKMFSDKKSIGIKVYNKAEKYAEIPISPIYDGKTDIQNLSFNHGSRMLAACSLPSVYDGEGYAGVAFGEHIKAVPPEDYSKGLIIDLDAAEILKGKGIDTGIVETGETCPIGTEIFEGRNNRVGIEGDGIFKKTVVDGKARIQSFFTNNGKKYPGSYLYENDKGQKFLVLCFSAFDCRNADGIFRQYERAKQIISDIPLLCGKELPAFVTGNPDLYVQLKENEKSVAVGLWNFCPDDIPEPIISLSFEPKGINTICCEAEINGRDVKLSRIEPFGFAAIELIK